MPFLVIPKETVNQILRDEADMRRSASLRLYKTLRARGLPDPVARRIVAQWRRDRQNVLNGGDRDDG